MGIRVRAIVFMCDAVGLELTRNSFISQYQPFVPLFSFSFCLAQHRTRVHNQL
jgi:hypothetical protein